MSSTEDADMLALVAAAPELATSDDTESFLDAMPIPELASMWGALQRLSRRDQTSGTWAALSTNHLSKRRLTARSISRSKCCAPNPTSRR
jgi:hypothetical protein